VAQKLNFIYLNKRLWFEIKKKTLWFDKIHIQLNSSNHSIQVISNQTSHISKYSHKIVLIVEINKNKPLCYSVWLWLLSSDLWFWGWRGLGSLCMLGASSFGINIRLCARFQHFQISWLKMSIWTTFLLRAGLLKY
jgi:hypothetical protein